MNRNLYFAISEHNFPEVGGFDAGEYELVQQVLRGDSIRQDGADVGFVGSVGGYGDCLHPLHKEARIIPPPRRGLTKRRTEKTPTPYFYSAPHDQHVKDMVRSFEYRKKAFMGGYAVFEKLIRDGARMDTPIYWAGVYVGTMFDYRLFVKQNGNQ